MDSPSVGSPALEGAGNDAPEIGTTLGRYEIGLELGRGGMGTVYRAIDPVLGRTVAIKVLRREVGGAASSLLAEAQAMAKLAHPNVVTVYEADVAAGRVFIAMEFVPGPTARSLIERQLGWRQVLDLYLGAARGLASAHRAGIVHRDFKPDNVLVGDDGRARVSDFGLALSDDGGPESAPSGIADTIRFSARAAGTPAYMSPEQHRGALVDARSDQFSYCVALHEALHGVRPFAGTTLPEIRQNVLAQRLVPPPSDRKVPKWLRAALLRGLAVNPASRYQSMEALVAVLEKDPAAARRRVLVGAGLLASSGLAIFALARGPSAAPPCDGAPDRVAKAWDAPTRDAMHARFLATGRPYAETTFARVSSIFDAYAAGWTKAHRETCEATALRHEQSPALLDARMRCLDRRLGDFGSLTWTFSQRSDAGALDRAIVAATDLGDVARCADPSTQPFPTDKAVVAKIAAFRPRNDEFQALYRTGRVKDAAALVGPLMRDVADIPYEPIQFDVYLNAGRVLGRSDVVAAEKALRSALRVAAEAHDDRGAIDAWNDLLYNIGLRQGKNAEALAMWPALETDLTRAGNPLLPRARALTAVASIEDDLGKPEEARRHFEEGIKLLEKDHGRDRAMAELLLLYSTNLKNLGDLDAAAAAARRCADIFTEIFGPDHPNVGFALDTLAETLSAEGKTDEALALQQRVLDSCSRSLGRTARNCNVTVGNVGATLVNAGRYAEALPYAKEVVEWATAHGVGESEIGASALSSLAQVELALGDSDAALADAKRSLAIRENALGSDDPALAYSLTVLASVHTAIGDPAGARPLVEKALALREKALGPTNYLVSDSLEVRAEIALLQKKPTEALADARRVTEIRKKERGDRHPDTGKARLLEGRALLALGRNAEAAEALGDAVAILDAAKLGDHGPLALARFTLAESLGPKEKARAVELARSARADLVTAPASRARLGEVNAWLARH